MFETTNQVSIYGISRFPACSFKRSLLQRVDKQSVKQHIGLVQAPHLRHQESKTITASKINMTNPAFHHYGLPKLLLVFHDGSSIPFIKRDTQRPLLTVEMPEVESLRLYPSLICAWEIRGLHLLIPLPPMSIYACKYTNVMQLTYAYASTCVIHISVLSGVIYCLNQQSELPLKWTTSYYNLIGTAAQTTALDPSAVKSPLINGLTRCQGQNIKISTSLRDWICQWYLLVPQELHYKACHIYVHLPNLSNYMMYI